LPQKAVGTLRGVVGAEGDDGAPERDDDPIAPRPDPLDRPWVHPSELRSYVANPAPAPQARPREWVIGVGSAIAGAVAAVLVLVAFGALGERTRSPLPPPIPTNENTAVDFGAAARVGQAMEPSIVTVQAKKGDTTEIASGVAVKSNRVMTSAHVLAGATAVTVVTNDRRNVPAKVMGSDPDTDLALLDVSADLAYPALAEDDAEIGDPVVAVAVSKNDAPFVAINVVNGRNVLVTTSTNDTLAGLMRVGISTTPETAGGGLFDTAGRLVGILVTPPTGFIPLAGLVVPVSIADGVRQQIESSGKVTHGWLGVLAEDTDRSGAKITAVAPDSPAAKAKLQKDDVITRAGGVPVASAADLMAEWRRRNPGETMSITYRRANKTEATEVTLTGPPGSEPTPADTTPATTAAPPDTTAAPSPGG
jgi:S1-C subfamily serine protease